MPDSRPRRLAALVEGLTAAHVDGLLVTSLANNRHTFFPSAHSAADRKRGALCVCVFNLHDLEAPVAVQTDSIVPGFHGGSVHRGLR